MKKIVYLLMVLGMVFTTSCDPMEEIYEDLGAIDQVITGETVYKVTDEDYKELGLTYGSFNSIDEVKTMLPPILTANYPVWGKGSAALTEFNLYVGSAFSIEDYSLTQADYTSTGSDLLGFKADQVPGDYLPGILATEISNPDEGDYVLAKYFQYTGGAYTVTPMVSLEENFDYGTATGDLLTVSNGVWLNHSGTDNQLQYETSSLSMTNYPTSNVGGSIMLSASGSEDVNTTIATIDAGKGYYSALIKLSEVGDGTYFIHFMEQDGSYNYAARVGAKSNGSGKVLFGIGASSSSLKYGTTAFDLDTTYLLVASYDIGSGAANLYVLTETTSSEPETPEATSTGNAGYSLQRIGIRQGGGGPSAMIDGIRAANTWSSIMSNEQLEDEIVGDKVAGEASYIFEEGVWETTGTDFYVLTDEDYDSMGTESGQPGKYNNFDSSMPPDDYIPNFLKIKYPYALEGDAMDIGYNYYSSGVQLRGNRYTFIEGMWVSHKSVIVSTLKFGQDGTTWVPDNTIKYTLTAADYALTGDDKYGNYYVKGMTDEDALNDVIVPNLNIVLPANFPNAEEGQKYNAVYNIYNGANAVWNTRVILVDGVYILAE